ncbi:hypothetical protein [Thalassotalea sp. PLHSN55]|uniref:hypothetical protein n=1 Tax=Thalassotalea sp. PLHSN55 TaxID=3435888 RepID=UPI003F866BCA
MIRLKIVPLIVLVKLITVLGLYLSISPQLLASTAISDQVVYNSDNTIGFKGWLKHSSGNYKEASGAFVKLYDGASFSKEVIINGAEQVEISFKSKGYGFTSDGHLLTQYSLDGKNWIFVDVSRKNNIWGVSSFIVPTWRNYKVFIRFMVRSKDSSNAYALVNDITMTTNPSSFGVSTPNISFNGKHNLQLDTRENIISYKVQAMHNNSFNTDYDSWPYIPIVSYTNNSVQLENRPSGLHQYRVAACTHDACSIIGSATVSEIGPSQPQLTSIVPTVSYDGNQKISWTKDQGGRSPEYKLYRSIDGEDFDVIYQGIDTSVNLSGPVGKYKYYIETCVEYLGYQACPQHAISEPYAYACVGGTQEKNLLFGDNFELGLFKPEWDNTGHDNKVVQSAAKECNFGASLKRWSPIIKKVETNSSSTLRIRYSRSTENLNLGQRVVLSYSYDNVSWTILETVSGGRNWEDKTFEVPSSSQTKLLIIKLNVLGVEDAKSLAYVDNIFISEEPRLPETSSNRIVVNYTSTDETLINSAYEQPLEGEVILSWGYNHDNEYVGIPEGVTHFELRLDKNGVEGEWQNIGAVDRIAFDQLTVGTYIINIRACNGNICSEPMVTQELHLSEPAFQDLDYNITGTVRSHSKYYNADGYYQINWNREGSTHYSVEIAEIVNGVVGEYEDYSAVPNILYHKTENDIYRYRFRLCNFQRCKTYDTHSIEVLLNEYIIVDDMSLMENSTSSLKQLNLLVETTDEANFTVASSNTSLVLPQNVTIFDNDGIYHIEVKPNDFQSGYSTITVQAQIGENTYSGDFLVIVNAAETTPIVVLSKEVHFYDSFLLGDLTVTWAPIEAAEYYLIAQSEDGGYSWGEWNTVAANDQLVSFTPSTTYGVSTRFKVKACFDFGCTSPGISRVFRKGTGIANFATGYTIGNINDPNIPISHLPPNNVHLFGDRSMMSIPFNIENESGATIVNPSFDVRVMEPISAISTLEFESFCYGDTSSKRDCILNITAKAGASAFDEIKVRILALDSTGGIDTRDFNIHVGKGIFPPFDHEHILETDLTTAAGGGFVPGSRMCLMGGSTEQNTYFVTPDANDLGYPIVRFDESAGIYGRTCFIAKKSVCSLYGQGNHQTNFKAFIKYTNQGEVTEQVNISVPVYCATGVPLARSEDVIAEYDPSYSYIDVLWPSSDNADYYKVAVSINGGAFELLNDSLFYPGYKMLPEEEGAYKFKILSCFEGEQCIFSGSDSNEVMVNLQTGDIDVYSVAGTGGFEAEWLADHSLQLYEVVFSEITNENYDFEGNSEPVSVVELDTLELTLTPGSDKVSVAYDTLFPGKYQVAIRGCAYGQCQPSQVIEVEIVEPIDFCPVPQEEGSL